uniref:GB1/RHD3-type G domain-containing protein n=1 Tax=Macrostomum lignano TaxID=282301 RepID=A0A1I8J5N8_9PLAT
NSKRDPDELASIELYEHLNQAGINDRGASKQCRAADGLEDAARQLNPDERLLIGSLAEGWSLSLLTDPQGNGLGKDSIKWLSFKIEDQAHLDGDCQCKGKAGQRLPVLDGRKDVTPLLNFVKNRVSARESDRVFQLFTALPMVELNDFEAFTGDALLYLLVQHLFNEIPKLQVDARKEFLQHIEKLRSLPSSSSVSACLVIMARLRLDDSESAKEKLQQVMWRHVEPCRFNFPCGVEPDFSFLPEFTRKLIKITPYGSGNMLQVNFHSLLMSLQAELLSKEQIFLNEWRRALEPDPDIDELYALAHYSRNTEQIRKCSKKIRELLDCENRGLGDAQKHWSVARKACFNGLFMVTILSVAWSILLNQRFFLDISNIIGQRLLPDLMRFRQTADKIFLELVLALT